MFSAKMIADIMKDLPDEKMNPLGDGMACVYTSSIDNTVHCIVGEVLIRLGVTLPDIDSSYNQEGIIELLDAGLGEYSSDDFEDTAINMLCSAQSAADYASERHNPLAWGIAKDKAYEVYSKSKIIAGSTGKPPGNSSQLY
jgi:hypothetical protein